MRLLLVAVAALLAAVIVTAQDPEPEPMHTGCSYVNRQPMVFFVKSNPDQAMCFGAVFCWGRHPSVRSMHAETICEATPEGGCPSAFDCIMATDVEYVNPANLAAIDIYSSVDDRWCEVKRTTTAERRTETPTPAAFAPWGSRRFSRF